MGLHRWSAARAAGLALVLLTAAATASAQAPGDAERPGAAPPTAGPAVPSAPAHRLGEVVVTATRTDDQLLNVPESVTVVGADEIARRRPESPALALREEPGLWVQRTGASGGSPILRGQIGNRVLYLVDGLRINNGALFGGPNSFFNSVQPWAIDRIEVIRGSGSVQYGSDAVGGVLNVLTRRVTDYPDEGVHYGGRSSVRWGSVDDLLQNDACAWVADRNFSVLAGGGFQDVDDYDGGGGFGEVDQTSYKTNGFYAKVGWRPSEHHLVEGSFQRFDRNDVRQYIQSKTNRPSGYPTLFTPNDERDLAQLRYEGRDLCDGLRSLDGYLYLQQYDALSWRTTELTTRFDRNETVGDQSIYGCGFQGVTPVRIGREHRLLWGGDVRKERLGSSARIRRLTKATGAVTRLQPQGGTPDGTYLVWDLFANLELSLRDNLTLSGGVRYEVTHLDSDPSPFDLVAPFTLEDLTLHKWWHSLTWSTGAVWWMTDDLGLSADVATGYRAPNFSDALSFSPAVFATTTQSVPSPDVAPEQSIQYEFGPRFAGERLSATVSAYYLSLDPLLTRTAVGQIVVPGVGVRTAMRNESVGQGFVRGIEASAEVRPVDGLMTGANLAYAFGRDEYLDVPLRFIPPLNGTFTVRYERPATEPHHWWVEASTRLVSRYTRHAPDDEIDAGFARDPGFGSPNKTFNPPLRRDFDLPGYAIVNLRAGVEVFRQGRVSGALTIGVENLLDKEYRETFSRQIVDPGLNVVSSFDLSF